MQNETHLAQSSVSMLSLLGEAPVLGAFYYQPASGIWSLRKILFYGFGEAAHLF
jgi:hypothetical protein